MASVPRMQTKSLPSSSTPLVGGVGPEAAIVILHENGGEAVEIGGSGGHCRGQQCGQDQAGDAAGKLRGDEVGKDFVPGDGLVRLRVNGQRQVRVVVEGPKTRANEHEQRARGHAQRSAEGVARIARCGHPWR